MSSILIGGDTSGSVTLQAPAVAGSTVLTLPVVNGTVALESQLLGVGQTWQNVTASRALGTTYTNSTGKPIQITVSVASSSNSAAYIVVSGVQVRLSDIVNPFSSSGTCTIPHGATYSVTVAAGTPALASWTELR